MAVLPKRFWDKVKRAGPNECWEWQSWRNADGYGEFSLNGRKHRAPRLVLSDTGVSVTGLVVRHTCDNRGCVNPAHLTVGTDADNIRDRDARGRGRWVGKKGSQNSRAKLTERTVIELRAAYKKLNRYESGRLMNGELGRLAERFNLPKGTVRNVVEGYLWNHI